MAKGTADAAKNPKEKLVGLVTKYKWYVVLLLILAAYYLFWPK